MPSYAIPGVLQPKLYYAVVSGTQFMRFTSGHFDFADLNHATLTTDLLEVDRMLSLARAERGDAEIMEVRIAVQTFERQEDLDALKRQRALAKLSPEDRRILGLEA